MGLVIVFPTLLMAIELPLAPVLVPMPLPGVLQFDLGSKLVGTQSTHQTLGARFWQAGTTPCPHMRTSRNYDTTNAKARHVQGERNKEY